MLFNSYPFIFVFLPITLIGFTLLGRTDSRRTLISWLIACSIAFYGVWNPVSLAIILPSIGINFLIARLLGSRIESGQAGDRSASWILAAGVAFNLCFLGYFKYKNFFLDSLNSVFGTQFPLGATLLPLGISFITFQKIAFLFDVRAGAIKRFSGQDFLIFVFFFPQLIAGPIVHYREMVPQFHHFALRTESKHLAVGLCLFSIGLFKKVILADGIAPVASSIFAVAEKGRAVGFVDAWVAALAFTFQIYFDFSGYSDMAIGLARMFGVRLPANFNSPLKATNIIEFWSRWHMTLTRFLVAYVYTPLVMALTRSRIATGKKVLTRVDSSVPAFAILVVFPTMVTMGLSGLWHGAGVTFIVWGLVHGVYLAINHAWRRFRPNWRKESYDRWMIPIGFVLTFVSVVVAMVLFRAKTFGVATELITSMFGLKGVSLPIAVIEQAGAFGEWLRRMGVVGDAGSGSALMRAALWIMVSLAIVLVMPNSLELMHKFEPALDFKLRDGHSRRRLQSIFTAELNPGWSVVFGLVLAVALLGLNRVSEFLYWQF